ncbi:hypothetical protein RRG08_038675 [Elysia crispata]|uniref:Uncharacterized protein n=1 Tax=Elysia crispata TaxID=231223 RepID=A0AAE0ZIP9_9GAST|nr:hypothetical protein RRG08_038675 [Elysia crispata]
MNCGVPVSGCIPDWSLVSWSPGRVQCRSPGSPASRAWSLAGRDSGSQRLEWEEEFNLTQQDVRRCRPRGSAMSGVTFVSDYILRDTLYPSHKEIAIQVSGAQVDRENSLEEGDGHEYDEDRPREREMFDHYLQSATIHGVAQTQGPHFYIHRRPLWLVLILSMTVLLGLTLFGEISHLYEYPAATVTRVSLRDELTFPAVTICNLNQYNKHRVPDIPIVKKLLYFQSDYNTLTRNYRDTVNMSDLDNMTDVSGEELRQIALDAAPRLDEVLIQCSWALRNFNCSDLFRPLQSGFGTCFVFNGPDVEPDQLAKARSTIHKLRVISVLDNDKSFFSRLIHAGLKVVVHEPEEAPFPEFYGSYVRPGVAALMALSRSDSIGLPKPYRAYSNSFCVDTKAKDFVNTLAGFKTYTRNHCLKQCALEKVYRRCGCWHYLAASHVRQEVLCSAKQLLTCYLSYMDLKVCPCPKECHSVRYSADVSYANIASAFIEEQAERDGITILSGSLRENVVDLSIFFKTLNVMEIEQEPEMSLTSVLGNLGGQMGLFLGASLLSITELAELVLLCSLTKVKLFCSRVRKRWSVGPSATSLQR